MPPDRLVLLPEDGRGSPVEIMFNGPTSSAVDPLVAAVWNRSKSWGYAGRGLSWRPTLSVQVAPGGQAAVCRIAKLDDRQRFGGVAADPRGYGSAGASQAGQEVVL